MHLEGFQKRIVAGVKSAPISAISLPRGNGKSWLAAAIAAAALRQAERGQEIALVAGSLPQGRIAFRFARQMLGEDGIRYEDSSQRISAKMESGARLHVMPASGRTAMGLVNTPIVIADEPGAWRPNDGELLSDAILTATGKPGSPMKVVFVGTLAPAGTPGHWWHDLVVAGTRPGYFVHLVQGDKDRWRDLRHIYAVNPLTRVSTEFRETLRRERDEAVLDTRLRARFLSYRLNLPTEDESKMLLDVADWQEVLRRAPAGRDGAPVVGVDLGGGRAWSAAVALWPSGLADAIAVCPGEPDIDAQEKRDRVPRGQYRRLVEDGHLKVANGLRVPEVRQLVDIIRWWRPRLIVCDRFRHSELLDCRPPCPVEPRVTRWSEAAADIRASRKLVQDGEMTVVAGAEKLLTFSLSKAVVQNDDAGNVRLVKKGQANTGRDDVAHALVLAAGAAERHPADLPRSPRYFVAGA